MPIPVTFLTSLGVFTLCFVSPMMLHANDETDSSIVKPKIEDGQEHTFLKYRMLGRVALTNGLYEEALHYFDIFYNSSSAFPELQKEAINYKLDALLGMGNLEMAKTLLDSYHNQLDTNDVYLTKARFALLENQMDSALLCLANLDTKLNAVQETQILAIRIAIAQEKGEWDQALSLCNTFEQMIQNSNDLNLRWGQFVRFRKIYFLIRSGYYQQASRMIEETIPVCDDERCNLLLLSAIAQAGLSQLYEAERTYTKAKLMPSFKQSLLAEAVAIELANRFVGINQYSIAVKLLTDVFHDAKNESHRADALLRIIAIYKHVKDAKNEILTRGRYVGLFPDAPDIAFQIITLAQLQSTDSQIQAAAETYQFGLNQAKLTAEEQRDIRWRYARLLYDEKQYASAHEELLHLTQDSGITPSSKNQALYLLGVVYQKEGKSEDALDAFSQLSQCSTWSARALTEKLMIYMNANNLKASLIVVDSLLLTPSQDILYSDAIFFKGKILEASGFADSALTWLDSYLLMDSGLERYPFALLEAGKIAYYHSYYPRANRYLVQLSKKFPTHRVAPQALYLQIFTAYQNGNEALAVNIARDLYKQYPESPFAVEAVFWMLNYYATTKEYNAIIALSTDFISQPIYKPHHVRASIEKARVLKISGTPKLAEELLIPLLQEEMDSQYRQEINFMLGEMVSARSDFAKAIPYYRAAASIDSYNNIGTTAFGRMGDCLCANYSATAEFDIKNLEEAQSIYSQLLNTRKLPTDISEQTYWKLGHVMQLLHKDKEAVIMYMTPILSRFANPQEQVVTDVWLIKSANSLLQIHKKEKTRQAVNAARRIVQIMITLKIEPVSHWQKAWKEMDQTYDNIGESLHSTVDTPSSHQR